MEVANIESLLALLVALRDSWKAEWNDTKLVACSLQVEVKSLRDRSITARKFYHDENTSDDNANEINEAYQSPEEAHIRKHIFYVVLDNAIGRLAIRFSAAKQISYAFSFLWNYQKMSR